MDLIFVITPSYHCAHLTSRKAKGGAKTKNHVPNHVPSHVPCQTSRGNSEHSDVVLELSWHTCVLHCVRIHHDCPGASVPSLVSTDHLLIHQLCSACGCQEDDHSGQAPPDCSHLSPPPFEDVKCLCLFWF